jgi:predicted transcriptional regulator
METLRYSSVGLHSVVLVSVHYRLGSMTVRVKESENGRPVPFWKRTDRWCEFSWWSVMKTATLFGVSRAPVSKVMSAYTNHGKTASAMRSDGRNSTLTERDRRTLRRAVSKNHRTTAVQMAGQQNLIFILKTLFPQKCPTLTSQIQHPRQGCNC